MLPIVQVPPNAPSLSDAVLDRLTSSVGIVVTALRNPVVSVPLSSNLSLRLISQVLIEGSAK